jgi:hypothetical protein
MNQKLTRQLFEKYPKIFAGKDKPITESLISFGLECDIGWYWLIDQLCGAIQSYVDSRNEGVRIRNKGKSELNCIECGKEKDDSCHIKYGADVDNPRKHEFVKASLEEEWQVEATQVKEKFGGLRFYINGADDTVYGMITLAEHMSYGICEMCGTTENVTPTSGWIKYLCQKCKVERENKK